MKKPNPAPSESALRTLYFVSLLTDPHTNSQPCSQGEPLFGQRLTPICEASEAIFLKLKEKEKESKWCAHTLKDVRIKEVGF